jgi:hypothetical protein
MVRAPGRVDDVQGLHRGQQRQAGVCRNIRGQLLRNEVLAGIGSAPCSHLARSIARRSSLLLLFFGLFVLVAGTVAAVHIAAAGAAAITLLFLGLLGLLGFLFLLGVLLGFFHYRTIREEFAGELGVPCEFDLFRLWMAFLEAPIKLLRQPIGKDDPKQSKSNNL